MPTWHFCNATMRQLASPPDVRIKRGTENADVSRAQFKLPQNALVLNFRLCESPVAFMLH